MIFYSSIVAIYINRNLAYSLAAKGPVIFDFGYPGRAIIIIIIMIIINLYNATLHHDMNDTLSGETLSDESDEFFER